MVKITLTEYTNLPNQSSMLPGIQEVRVDGTVVGLVAKNKHGIWLGTFDRDALAADNPFAASRLSHRVKPSIRGLRHKRHVVADIAARRVGEYEAELQQIRQAARERRIQDACRPHLRAAMVATGYKS